MELPIRTDRLTLRPPEDADAEAIARYAGDPEVARWTAAMPHPYPVEVAEGWIVFARIQRRRGQHFALMVEARDEGVVGCAGVFRRTPDADWEVGYWIGRPFWGRGYATEALGAVSDWARRQLHVRRLTASYFEGNAASARVLAKAGYRPTGETHELYSIGRRARVRCVDMAAVSETAAA